MVRTVALLLFLSAGPALAGAWPAASAKWLRSWDFGRDGDGEDTCTVHLRDRASAGGYALTAKPNCRAVPGAARIRAWAPAPDGGIVFNDAAGGQVYGFRLDPHHSHLGWGLERVDAQGRGWIMNPTLGPPRGARRK